MEDCPGTPNKRTRPDRGARMRRTRGKPWGLDSRAVRPRSNTAFLEKKNRGPRKAKETEWGRSRHEPREGTVMPGWAKGGYNTFKNKLVSARPRPS